MTTVVNNTTEKDRLLRFPLEEDFMTNKSVNGMLYAKLQHLSYFNETNKKRYVYKDDVNFSEMEIEEFKEICGRKKLSRDLNTLKKLGFVVEGVEGRKKVYYLPFDSTKFFQLVPSLTVEYILTVKSVNCIKVYVYLLDKFFWKIKEGNGLYRFTKKELNLAIGLSDNATNNRKIDFILNSLKNEGLISYKEVLVPSTQKNKAPIPYFEITNMNTKVKGLNDDKKSSKKEVKKTVVKPQNENEQINLPKENEEFFQNWIEHLDKQIKEGKDFIAF